MHVPFQVVAFTLPSGTLITLRELRAEDAGRFGDYLEALGAGAPRETAEALCAGYETTFDALRLVAVTREDVVAAYVVVDLKLVADEHARFAGYGYTLDDAHDCGLAPSVAERYQHGGLEERIVPHAINYARRIGRRFMILSSGVRSEDARAVQFYLRLGFRRVGDFIVGQADQADYYDMMLVL